MSILKNETPCHVWSAEEAKGLVPGAKCHYFVHRDQKFSEGTVMNGPFPVQPDPNYMGGYRVYIQEEADPVSIAMFDKNTLVLPEPLLPKAADGLERARAGQIAALTEAVKNIAQATTTPPLTVRQRHPTLVNELVALVRKDTAQQYEAIIEQRVKETVEQRVQAALKARKEELEAEYSTDSQEYLETLRTLRDKLVEQVDELLGAHAEDQGAVGNAWEF